MVQQRTLDGFFTQGAKASPTVNSSPSQPRKQNGAKASSVAASSSPAQPPKRRDAGPDPGPDPDALPAEPEVEASREEDILEQPPPRKVVVEILKGMSYIRPPQKALDSADPPISDIPSMFKDMVRRFGGFQKVLEFFSSKEAINVATMCSGTESPLLALKMIDDACFAQHGIHLRTNHIFSCEIVDYKQAYIERNFQPKILFRDVCELGQENASTAYGSEREVPLDCDMLIAGTSCVDYSTLNNHGLKITDNGESGRTFRGMMGYVRRARPQIIILENVCKAPWDEIVKYFREEGYAATHIRMDTKDYYIPHTRNRVYLVAFDVRKGGKAAWSLPEKWKAKVQQMSRPASSAFDAFLLPADDPRIHRAREKLVQEAASDARGRAKIDWGRCEGRHQRARVGEELGTRRPFTYWEDGGKSSMPDWTWMDWAAKQVERVWDLLDITVLRYAKEDWDPSYKTLVWNLSQNVDRQIGSGSVGICPCLTPSMIPYITNRGGPMTGLEALSLQGLPIDQLLLTRESEDNLADLAGNAMTSTVVGSGIMTALYVAFKLLFDDMPERMDIDEDGNVDDEVEAHIAGNETLVSRPLDLAAVKAVDLKSLLDMAQRSARLCICEGRSGMTTRPIGKCKECGVTGCERCAGRPTHSYVPYAIERVAPGEFETELKAALPMCLAFNAITDDELQGLLPLVNIGEKSSMRKDTFATWRQALLDATKNVLRFTSLKRQEHWIVNYESTTSRLELVLYPSSKPTWSLFVKPDPTWPSNSQWRIMLAEPILRSTGKKGFFDGAWEYGLPVTETLNIQMEGTGSLVPSFASSLGLQNGFKDEKVWDTWKVQINDDHLDVMDVDISGEYKLLPDCGTAARGLHKRIKQTPEEKDLFLFRDPKRGQFAKDDCFVFSSTTRRLDHGEVRPVVATLEKAWRESSAKGPRKVAGKLTRQWVDADGVQLKPVQEGDASYAIPTGPPIVNVEIDKCKTATAVLTCEVPIKDDMADIWSKDHWTEVDVIHERAMFQGLSWLTERVKSISALQTWTPVRTASSELPNCATCAPPPPALKWARGKTQRIVAIEDMPEAGRYEQALKNRPTPFITQCKLQDGIGTLRIGVNFASLVHRAAASLPKHGRVATPALAWRLTTDYSPSAVLNLPKFRLKSNRYDRESKQPPHFDLLLRPEQLRSLTWMLQQEAQDAKPFIEEEIAEAMLEPLGWRAEGRATRAAVIRGGVLADQVGYGKTAITLGLIDMAAKRKHPPLDQSALEGRIPALRTTCIIVPPHLIKQWPAEFRKFMRDSDYDIVVIESLGQLNKTTVEEILDAKVVIVASNIFQSDKYVEKLAALAGSHMPSPKTAGRHYRARLDETLKALRGQMSTLMDEEGGGKAVYDAANLHLKKGAEAEEVIVVSKRVKGKKYREMHANDSTANAVANGKNASSKKANEPASSSPFKRKRSDDDDDDVSEDEEPAIKKKKAIKDLDDYWMLKSVAVRKNWRKMQCPPLEAFHFERLVIDEYTYLKDAPLAAITKISSLYRWILSGTPPVHDFASVKTIAVFLDVHLGIDDATEGKSEEIKKMRNEQTSVEKFHSFREVHSTAWHTRRHQKGQEFLDHFVRQNIAEIDEIPCDQSLKMVHLPAAERAIYLELLHHLMALDMTVKKGKRGESDRDKRLAKSLGDSQSAEEALLKRSSHFDLDMDGVSIDRPHAKTGKKGKKGKQVEDSDASESESEQSAKATDDDDDDIVVISRKKGVAGAKPSNGSSGAHGSRSENALQACDIIVRDRTQQRDDCEADLLAKVKDAAALEQQIGAIDENSPFRAWIRGCEQRGVNDKDASRIVVKLIRSVLHPVAPSTPVAKLTPRDPNTSPSFFDKGYKTDVVQNGKGKPGKKENQPKATMKAKKARKDADEDDEDDDDDDDIDVKQKKKSAEEVKEELKWDLRELTHVIRRLEKELVGRVRSLRYFSNVRDIQQLASTAATPVVCPRCPYTKGPLSVDDLSLLSSCGHMGCRRCVLEHARHEECIYRADGCGAQARELNIVHANTLGQDETHDRSKKHYGKKLEQIMSLINNEIPKQERVLIFVQFQDLTEKVAEALAAHKISFLEIKGTASAKSRNLQRFQDPRASERVLLLNVMDESASGANLTVANHAIFMSPLLTPTQEIYEANETQAIGRLQRFGQTKTVNVYRFLTANSIDVTIFENRTGIKVDITQKTIKLDPAALKRAVPQKLEFDYIEVPPLDSVGHRSARPLVTP